MTTFIDYLRTHLKPLIWVCCALLAVIAVSSTMIDTSHAHSWVEKHIPAYWSLFGFVAAVVIIAVAKWLGRSGLQVREDFYDGCTDMNTCEEKK